MEKEKTQDYLIKIFWVFMIGSVVGFLVETLVAFLKEGHYANRQGLLYGPFIQIYGIGAVVYYLFIPKIKQTKYVFPICMLVGGILEYFFSYTQEIFFGTISWDYSHYFFNLNGRTSLLHCFYWGIAGIVVLKILCPLMKHLEPSFHYKMVQKVTLIIAIFMLCNITISWSAANRQEERGKQIPPKDKWDSFLDQHYPDEIMDKVYANKIKKAK